MKYLVLFVLCLSSVGFVSGQDAMLSDTLNSVVISDNKLGLLDSEVRGIDSATISPSLVNVLSKLTTLQIQTNGPAGLATPLIHGLAARHTAIIWEGMNIQSPINGTHDIRLLRGFGEIKFATKSLSPRIGTASLGGALIIQDKADALNSLSAGYSNIGNMDFGIKLSKKLIPKLESSLNLNVVRNNNNYNYRDNTIQLKQMEAALDGVDVRMSNRLNLSQAWKFQSNIWVQTFDRQVAPSITSTTRNATQKDKNLRLSNSLKYVSNDFAITVQHGYFNEQLDYNDVSVNSEANNNVQLLKLIAQHGNHFFQLQHRTDKVNANFFEEIFKRNISRLNYNYNHAINEGYGFNIALSQHIQDGDFSPLLFDVAILRNLDNHALSFSVNRSYNTPTFNDLYWPVGGNILLRPETALSFDLNWVYANPDFKIEVDTYYKKISDWILWQPNDGIWSPRNERSVLARGIDLSISKSVSTNWSLSGYFALSLSTIQEDASQPALDGKQLLYIPRVKSGFNINYYKDKWSFASTNNYISTRYASTDNEVEVSPYFVSDMSIGFQLLAAKKQSLAARVGANNIFNNDYEHVRFYPMPLRNIFIQLDFKFK